MELTTAAHPDLARARFEQALSDSAPEFGRFFFARFLDLDIGYDDAAQTCTVRLPAAPYLHNPQGSMHGGVLATAMDISMGHLCHRYLSTAMTLEMQTRFLAPVHGSCWCRGAVVARRGRTVVLSSHLYDEDDDLVAVSTATWRLLEPSTDTA